MVMKKPCPACRELIRVEARRCQFCMTSISHGEQAGQWRAAVLALAIVIVAAAAVLAVVG
jgi:hypothetical protein